MSIEDRAQELELAQWEARNVGRESKPVTYQPGEVGYGPAECDECGSDMHPVRRAYGFRICVPCKELMEAETRLMMGAL